MGILKWIFFSFCILPCSSHIYTNHWGVHIEGGHHIADEVADEHGFTNHGQVSKRLDYIFFLSQQLVAVVLIIDVCDT